MIRKRLISMLLCAALLLTLLPGAVFAARPTRLNIGDAVVEDMTKDAAGNGWAWSAADRTLTLDGYAGGSILADGDLTILLPDGTSSVISDEDTTCALQSAGNLIIEGGGTLSVIARGDLDLYGILASNRFELGGAVTLTVDAKASGVRTATGIQSTRGDLIVRDNANLTVYTSAIANDYEDNPYAFGLYTYASVRITTTGSVDVITNATGEIATATGIRTENDLELDGNTALNVTATSDGGSAQSYGISAWGEINVGESSSLSATATGAGTGIGIIFESENPYASTEDLAVKLDEEIHHFDVSGSTGSVMIGTNTDKSDLDQPDPDRFVSTGSTASDSIVIDRKTSVYTIIFDGNGGDVTPATAKTGGDGRLTSLPVPTMAEGYRFDGWYNAPNGGRAVTSATTFTGDTTIYAHWTYISPEPGKQTIALGAFLRDDEHYFLTDALYVYPLAAGQEIITLYAYAPSAVSGVCLNTVIGAQPEKVTVIESVIEGYVPITLRVDPDNPIPIRLWLSLTDNDEYYDAVSNVLTISVKKYVAPEYTLSFATRGGDPIKDVTAKEGTVIDLSTYRPVREGYTFAGWYLDSELTLPAASVTLAADTVVYAKWTAITIPTYRLSFNTLGGSRLNDLEDESGTTIALAGFVPVREGYSFVGWYAERALTTPVTSVTLSKDTTVYAKWEKLATPTYALSFDTRGGSQLEPIVRDEGTRVDLSAITPTRKGYVFAGWFSDMALTHQVASVTLSADTVVYAKWIEENIPTYTLHFETYDGSAIADIIDKAGTIISLGSIVPTRALYSFGGWYADEAMKKPVSIVTLSANTTVYARWDPIELPFIDVRHTDWFFPGIAYCYINGYMNGMSDTIFQPNGVVTRAQLVTILYRLEGEPEVEFRGTFSDVPDGQWYSAAIEWAAEKGVVNGIGGGKFAPAQKVTREQIAAILYRYSGDTAPSGKLDFPDSANVSPYAVEPMLWATQKGLITGISTNGTLILSPRTSATRAQISAIIMRFLTQ